MVWPDTVNSSKINKVDNGSTIANNKEQKHIVNPHETSLLPTVIFK